jgi:hypothetical protein
MAIAVAGTMEPIATTTDLTHLAASATRRAFEKTADVWVQSLGGHVTSLLISRLPSLVAEVSGAFAVEFASVLLKMLLDSEDSLSRIDKNVSKLVQEPLKTALEQFRVASALHPDNESGRVYREQGFRESLASFDRARSVAEDHDTPLIDLLRGICALQMRGGGGEAKVHLRPYARACTARANSLQEKAAAHDERALQNEWDAAKIQISEGYGLGWTGD